VVVVLVVVVEAVLVVLLLEVLVVLELFDVVDVIVVVLVVVEVFVVIVVVVEFTSITTAAGACGAVVVEVVLVVVVVIYLQQPYAMPVGDSRSVNSSLISPPGGSKEELWILPVQVSVQYSLLAVTSMTSPHGETMPDMACETTSFSFSRLYPMDLILRLPESIQ
jgi:hypothetical protein